MASPPYGLLVEDNENDVSDSEDTDKSETYSSQRNAKTDTKCNENDCDIITCSTPPLPYSLENTEEESQEKCIEDIRNNTETPTLQIGNSPPLSVWGHIRKNWTLFVIKPVMIFYGLQYAVVMAATTQLWLERSCSVDFHLNDTICNNLNDPKWRDYQNLVQQKVTEYQIVNTYLNGIPPIIIGLYIGPLSDRGRKLLMYIPFIAHLISGLFPFYVVYYETCSPKFLWLTNLYVLGGGYSVLGIAMYGYIGDVTNERNRTTIMSLLAGLGLIIFPLGIGLGGLIYTWSGYYAVYGCSLAFTILGLIYIYFVPESVTSRNIESTVEHVESPEESNCCQKIRSLFYQGNQTLLESFRCLTKERPNGMRKLIHGLLGIFMFAGMAASWNTSNNGLLFTERMFGWELIDYTNFTSFAFVIVALRTFVTTPILCYLFGMHDCMLAIIGGMASITSYVVTALATKGWMMYYASSLSIIGGLTSTPLQSMLSKCVSRDEYGKIFTLSSVAVSISSLISSTFLQKLYEYTVETFPGAMYVALSGMELITILLMSIFFIFVIRHEREFGTIGKVPDETKSE